MLSAPMATMPINRIAFRMSGKTGIPASVSAMTNGEAVTPEPPKRRGSLEGTRSVAKVTISIMITVTRIGTSLAAWAILWRGEAASPAMIPVKIWSPQAQMARSMELDIP